MFIFIAEHNPVWKTWEVSYIKEYEIGSEIYVVCTLTLSGPSLRLRQARGPSAPHVLHLIPHQLPVYTKASHRYYFFWIYKIQSPSLFWNFPGHCAQRKSHSAYEIELTQPVLPWLCMLCRRVLHLFKKYSE